MSREIKFRAWNEEEKVMIDGDSLAFEEYAPISELLSKDGIMQFVGLYDSKEVYEGDIILVTPDDGESYKTTVSYDDGAFSVDIKGYDFDITAIGWAITIWNNENSTWEVIGNIYENPELLGESHEP